MAGVSTYLNFKGEAEAAGTFYKSVFGTEFDGEISRFGDLPPAEDMPPLPEAEKDWVMHLSVPIVGDHKLMISDVASSWGGDGLVMGNNFYISLNVDSRAEADRLFAALSEGGKVEMAMNEEFWGDYFGSFKDKFGVQWMVSTSAKA
jgi:PhnB protein